MKVALIKKVNKNRNFVFTRNDFNDGIAKFKLYIPIYVEEQLKDDFHGAITSSFISDEIESWKAVLIPLKGYWKFIREN
ncbi:MAG: hypothetical protein IPK91_02575 [Saprospiraceae bacterium]|nr:hypothetical protein [Saprospiraceae bacterium]MBK8296174.1 hypothetical protein [Saprospiraceae bacterium]